MSNGRARKSEIETDEEPWRRHPGPVLLLAGPGTGKTHQLALRIKDLITTRGVKPEEITVITFTKEAAENMRRRIADEEKKDVYMPPESRPAKIMTMHSLGLAIVRAHSKAIGLPDDFSVVTDSVLRRVLFRDAALLAGCTEAEGREADMTRQRCLTPEAGEVMARIVSQYETILRLSKAIDYDDQILLSCQLLSANEEIRRQYGVAASHLLVDEYQDINTGQHRLIRFLSQDHPDGLFVVGDDDQSIYSFRGGSPEFIRGFREEYGDAAVLLGLVKSRRCPGKILTAAACVVESFDHSRLAKPAFTFAEGKGGAGLVEVHDMPSDDREAEAVARISRQFAARKEVLILVPAKQYADVLKRELRKRQVGYAHHPSLDDSGFALLQRIYEWVQNPADNFALRLCIEGLCEGGTVGMPSRRAWKAETKQRRHEMSKEIAALWLEVFAKGKTLWEVLATKSEGSKILSALHERLEPLRTLQASDASGFLGTAVRNFRPWHDVADLMKEVRGWMEELRTHGQPEEGRVRIMTLQAAKGLEADVVCVIGLNDGILPRSDLDEAGVEEAARLAYVSMTRAKEELHLFHARTRSASSTFLSQSYQLKPSKFVTAIDQGAKQLTYHRSGKKKPAKVGSEKDVRIPS